MRLAAALFGLLFLGGRDHRETLRVHYLSGFVPGTRNVLASGTIAIAPVAERILGAAGATYDESGHLEKKLIVTRPGEVVARALQVGLSDAGLKPERVSKSSNAPPAGFAYLLRGTLDEFHVEKRFGAQVTVHGRYFSMVSRVKIGVKVLGPNGREIFSVESVGEEKEPPKPVEGEVFLPLEEDPADSLSVAMSRAVGDLVLKLSRRPEFRSAH